MGGRRTGLGRERAVAAAWLCCVLATATAAAAETGPSWVLGPGVEGPVRAALEGEGPLDGRLVLQEARIEGDRVRVRYGGSVDGPAALDAELVRPAEGGRGFAARAVPGGAQDAEALKALQARVAALDFDPWTAVARPEDAGGGGGIDEATLAARREVTEALRAWHVGDEERARQRLRALGEGGGAVAGARLEVAEAWWRMGDGARGRAVAEQASRELGDQPAAWRARAQILSGEDLGWEAARDSLRAEDALCEAGPVAEAYAATGATARGRALLEAAAAEPRCEGALITLIDWLIDASEFEEALRVSGPLLEREPQSAEVRARRARALMALGRPKEAAETLEPVAWASPDSGLISSLLGAYNRVPDPAWQAAKRDELLARVAASPDDPIAAFLAGVLLHYEGQFERSDALLRPLVPIFGKQPRLFIYMGMNAFNLGRRDEALALIERAMALEAPDPDVYYCRAEIYRWSDPELALADLDRYLAEERGSATQNELKTRRVVRMRELLAACIERGDPIPCVGPWEHPRGNPANRDPLPADAPAPPSPADTPWMLLAGLALALAAVAVAALAWSRRGRAARNP
ncbi:MAG: tetratricopeptide repeat protein [Deltaproteobacteria bacterium]|nr:tetratricopeptide repeat protein [Deltaproteobacteria bacterium]